MSDVITDERPDQTPRPPECDFCGKAAHFGSCVQLEAFVDRMRAYLAPSYRCNSCGDPIGHDGLCPACVEAGEGRILSSIVHDAAVDQFGIPLTLRAAIREDAAARETIDSIEVPF